MRGNNNALLFSFDHLVISSGWNPGEGRIKPPLSHAEFAAKFKEWVEKGAAVPK
jgi:hypothetical protein